MSIQFLKSRRPALAGTALALVVVFSVSTDMRALQGFPGDPQAGSIPDQARVPGRNESSDPALAGMRRRQLIEQNAERQKQLQRDTDKLLELAQELKDEVNKTNKNVLSVDVVKKAAEIEKLAKSVREKMKGGYIQAP